jgi:dipeptidyl aminopeptidase/acylaminoacyl peptidase
VYERTFSYAGIPLLALAQDGQPRPVVLFYHGLHTDKETHRPELMRLAERGFLALGVDAACHGQRRMPDLRGFVQRGELLDQVSKLLRPSLEEIPLLVDFLEEEGYGPFGLMGISFGGLLAFAAPQRESRLRSVVSLLGDPTWCHPYENQEHYRKVGLLAINGGLDENVPPTPARQWMQHLLRWNRKGRYQYLEYPESAHFMRGEDWEDAWKHSLDWLSQGLTCPR